MNRSASLGAICLSGLMMASSACAAALQLTSSVNAGEFAITPDGSHVVFQSYNGSENVLYSAQTDAVGSPIQISPTVGSSFLFNGQMAPDSSTFVFNNYENPNATFHVATYSSRLDGSGAPVLLNRSKVYDDDASNYNLAISPHGKTVVIHADQGDFDFDLLSRPIDASLPAIPLNDNPHSGGFSDGVGIDWIAAGNLVVFRGPRGEDGANLYTRVFDGSLPTVQLNPGGKTFVNFVVSRDGSKVALTADGVGGRALYSRGIDGTQLRILTAEDDNPRAFDGFLIDPHGEHVIFSTDDHLWTVPTDGSANPTSLSPSPFGYAFRTEISPTGSQVAFTSVDGNGGPQELFVSPIDGSGLPIRLSAPLPPGGNINSLRYSPDSRHIVYLGDQLTDGVDELFSVLADGSAAPVRLAGAGAFRITPDGQNVIYAVGSALAGGIRALYAIGIDGGEPVLLAENPYPSGGILPWGEGWQISPDGSLLIFTADDGAGTSAIFAVAIPEPGCLGLVSAAMLSLRGRRRRQLNPR